MNKAKIKATTAIMVALGGAGFSAYGYARGYFSAHEALNWALLAWVAMDVWVGERSKMLGMSMTQIYHAFRDGTAQVETPGWLGRTLHRGTLVLFAGSIISMFAR